MASHICHISVLNPSLHPRIFYKLAKSQQKMGYRVSVYAQDNAEEAYEKDEIIIHPVKPFHRLSAQRLFFSILHFRKLKRLRADIYTLHSPQLLLLGVLLKWTTGAKIIYDVHEDYALTIRQVAHYPGFWGNLLASWVRGIERWAVKRIHAVSYAEDIYDDVLKAGWEKKFFLRNKFYMGDKEKLSEKASAFDAYMLYTGTLAEDWGIFRSIDLWAKMNEHKPLYFIMAGVSPHKELVEEINKRVAYTPYVDRFIMVGGNEYVPYEEILDLIRNCRFGTALYSLKPHIKGKMPTKFYEYMAFDKPLIYTKEESWDAFNYEEKLGLPYSGVESGRYIWQMLEAWEKQAFQHESGSYSWEGEESELKRMLEYVEGC